MRDAKIVGGIEANPHSIPSQILLRQTYTFYYNSAWRTIAYSCGGTIMRSNVVLTAAHCINNAFRISDSVTINFTPNSFYPTLESTFAIYAGIHDQSFLDTTINPPAPGVRVGVSKIVRVLFMTTFIKIH